jgi:hypothetical protein
MTSPEPPFVPSMGPKTCGTKLLGLTRGLSVCGYGTTFEQTGKDDIGDALATLWASSLVNKAPIPSKNLLPIRAQSIVVDCDSPPKLWMDGEVLEINPVTLEVVPNGLNVITPIDKTPEKD